MIFVYSYTNKFCCFWKKFLLVSCQTRHPLTGHHILSSNTWYRYKLNYYKIIGKCNWPFKSKVGGLCNVEPMVEPRVVGVGEHYDGTPLFLDHLGVRDAVFVQLLGRDETSLVPHKVGTPRGHVGKQLSSRFLHQVAVLGRNHVPRLGRAVVQVVDWVQVHVFHVPAEKQNTCFKKSVFKKFRNHGYECSFGSVLISRDFKARLTRKGGPRLRYLNRIFSVFHH